MNILFFGGGRQLGQSIGKKIEQTNDSLTMVNRGLSANFEELNFPENISYIRSSKKDYLEVSDLNMYDLIIDTCAYAGDDFNDAKEKLLDFKGIYALISSVYVYKNSQFIINENSCLSDAEDWQEDKFNATYASEKINCENIIIGLVRRPMIIRSGVLLGPHDHTKRMYYWLDKIKKTEPIPLLKNRNLQILHPDNLVDFIFNCANRGITGIYNTCGTVLRYENFLNILSTELGLNYLKLNFVENTLMSSPPFFEINNKNIYSSIKAQEIGFIPNDSKLLLKKLMRESFQ